jgi:SAM-dependent methyltransferase
MNTAEYQKLAETEDRMWYFRSLHAHVRRELTAVIGGSEAAVLDAGCGTGGLIARLRTAEPGWKWSGIDVVPLACDLTRKRCGPGVKIQEASITALPFADESFDAVVTVDVICQVDHPAVALGEFFRVLRPGGVVVINVPAYMWMWSYHDEACQTKRRYARIELDALLAGARFVDARLSHWNALPFPVVWARRKIFRRATDTSDVKAYPAVIEMVFSAVMAVEHMWCNLGGKWAWGTSILATARKPA